MRRTFRLLASVKPARYLEAGAPTGLTGLYTNASPRSTLLFLYSSTIDKLKAVPESSVYRQSVEALTKHRLSIVEGVKPAGYDEWLAKARETLEAHPEYFQEAARKTADGSHAAGLQRDGKFFVLRKSKPQLDMRDEEWDGEPDEGPELEGSRTVEERKYQEAVFQDPFEGVGVEWVDEPKLTAVQYVQNTKIPWALSCHVYVSIRANMDDTGLRSSRTRLELALSRRSFRLQRESSGSLTRLSSLKRKFILIWDGTVSF